MFATLHDSHNDSARVHHCILVQLATILRARPLSLRPGEQDIELDGVTYSMSVHSHAVYLDVITTTSHDVLMWRDTHAALREMSRAVHQWRAESIERLSNALN